MDGVVNARDVLVLHADEVTVLDALETTRFKMVCAVCIYFSTF